MEDKEIPSKVRAGNAVVRENLPGCCIFEEYTMERKATWSKDIHRLSGNSRSPGQGSGRKTGGSEARWSGVDASRRPFGSRHKRKDMAHVNAYQNAFNVGLAFNWADKIVWIVGVSQLHWSSRCHHSQIHRLGSRDGSYARTQKQFPMHQGRFRYHDLCMTYLPISGGQPSLIQPVHGGLTTTW